MSATAGGAAHVIAEVADGIGWITLNRPEELNTLSREMKDLLFEATAAELFEPELAARFTEKAHRIAGSLELAIFHRPGAPPEGLSSRRTEGR